MSSTQAFIDCFNRCVSNIVSNYFRRPTHCRGLARVVSMCFEECSRDLGISSFPNDLLRDIYLQIRYFLQRYYEDCSTEEFSDYLNEWSRNLPLAYELSRFVREEVRREREGEFQRLRYRFSGSSTYRRFAGNVIEKRVIPIYEPRRTSRTFSQLLSEILGVNPDVTRNVFYEGDYQLFEHQDLAVRELVNKNNKVVIVSTPNASGKTEIGILTVMGLLHQYKENVLVLVIYPTRALAKDQFERWRSRLERFYQVIYGGGNVNNYGYCLETSRFYLILLDRETSIRLRRQDVDILDRIRRDKRPLVVLTNPAFLLSIIRGNLWDRYFGRRCLLFLILDEIHFYKARDLTLLVEVLGPIISLYSCKSGGKRMLRALLLSATIGDPNTFINQLRKSWSDLDWSVIEAQCGNNSMGARHVYIIKASDDREAESIIISFVRELIENAIRPYDIDKTLIFVPNRNIAERIWRELQGIAVRRFRDYIGSRAYLLVDRHLGDMALWERERVEQNFKTGETRILITVKTLEIGIDIGDVRRIIHWGLPSSINDLVQREGRAGRRPGESESIIIVTTPREEELAKKYLEIYSGSPQQIASTIEKYIYTPIINTDAKFIRALRYEIRRNIYQRIKRLIPDSILLQVMCYNDVKKIEYPISFYSQDRRQFIIMSGNGRKLREVRIEDVLYRYLPGMIRQIGQRDYIVTEVVRDKKGKPTNIIRVEELNDDVLGRVWENNVINKDFCLRTDLIRNGRVFTVSDIRIEFEVCPRISPQDLDTIIIHKWANGTKLVRVDYKRIERRLPDGNIVEVELPIFKLCGYLPLPDDLKKDFLRTRIVTRGIYITERVKDIEVLYNTLLSQLQDYAKIYTEVLKSCQESAKEIEESFKTYCIALLYDYVHYATHLMLNIACEVSGLRPEDLEHYVNISIDNEELLKSFLRKLLFGETLENELPLRLEIVIANEVDLVNKINWIQVNNEVRRLSQQLQNQNINFNYIIHDIIPRLYIPRCYHAPQGILERLIEQRDIRIVLNELNIILKICEHALCKIIKEDAS